MKLSTRRHGFVKVFYYQDPAGYHRYKLSGRTIAQRNWMFAHIADRLDINKGDLMLVADADGDVRMINRKTGGRLYTIKTGKYYTWHEEPALLTMANMHEHFDYNQ